MNAEPRTKILKLSSPSDIVLIVHLETFAYGQAQLSILCSKDNKLEEMRHVRVLFESTSLATTIDMNCLTFWEARLKDCTINNHQHVNETSPSA